MHATKLLTILVVAALAAGVPGQQSDRQDAQRWLVEFEARSFDLSEFRAANRPGAPERVARVVAGLERKVAVDQASFLEAIEELGGRVVDQWWIVNGCCIEVPVSRLDAVRQLPNVRRLQPDTVCLPLVKQSTNAANHNSDAANALGHKGAGIAAAIMDSGLDERCGNKARPHRTFYPEGDLTKTHRLIANKQIGLLSADNVNPHGTAIASIVAGGRWTSSNGDNGHAPLASIAGYSIANSSSGGTTFQVMIKAWQTIAADAASLKIKTANSSYAGSPDPTHLSQQALDACALNADVLVVVAAGNIVQRTDSSQSCANGIAAAAVDADVHTVASFSSRGPLTGDLQRFYPDLSALGVGRTMALVDNEKNDHVASGTSFSCANVCGAATLIRGQNKTMNAVETKAVLIASALDISARNPTLDRNGYGLGLVKSDNASRLVSASDFGRAVLTPTQRTFRRTFTTEVGKTYRFAVAWMRQVMASTAWANLDVVIKRGTTVVTRANTPRNLYELAGFRSKGGSHVVEVTATSLEAGKDQPFGWAWTEGELPPVVGSYVPFGKGCPGTGKLPNGKVISPGAYASKWGESGNFYPHGQANLRYQQLHNASEFPAPQTILGMSYRLDDTRGGPAGSKQIEYLFCYTDRNADTMSATYATNYKGTPVSVFKGQIKWPSHPGGNKDLASFAVSVKFDRPWVYDPQGGSLLWEALNTSTTSLRHYFDWARTSNIPVRRVWGLGVTRRSGTRDSSHGGLVTRFDTLGTPGAVPAIGSLGLPEIGKSFDVTLANAKPSTAAGLITGASNTKWRTLPLPFKLDVFGAPGCFLNVSFDIIAGVATDTFGTARVPFPLPNDKALINASFHNQFLVVDRPQNNTLGMVWSPGATALIGGRQ